MNDQEPKDEWIHLEENDPPPDLSREEAAYRREWKRLVRDHLGKIAVIRFDDIVGVYDTLDEATIDAHRRFGWKRMIFVEITATHPDEPEYIANFDPNHPSFKKDE
jgi:hypothetical protein